MGFLTDDELEFYTGYKQPKAQIRFLQKWNVRHVLSRAGYPHVTWNAVNGIEEDTTGPLPKKNGWRRNGSYWASSRQRTPKWADVRFCDALYQLARRMTACTGIPFHIDHIIPLNGRAVSGLHVESNIRIITSRKNARKSNLWDLGN